MNLPELIDKLHSEEACRKHLESIRWPNGITCPKCGHKGIARIHTRNTFECNKCQHTFSITSGTIFHDTHLPLQKWFLAIHRISESKKGVSANQLKRELGISYKTAWYLCHRIREALKQPKAPGLKGVIEIDETYVKGKGIPPGEKLKAGRGSQRTTPVLGMKERKGKTHAKVIANLSKKATWPWILQQMEKAGVDAVYTDANMLYRNLSSILPHESVDHSVEYVLGDVHTNGIESFWSLLKRGIIGSYHHVSPKHLQKYVDEYCWRANQGKDDDLFDNLLAANAKAKPLQYQELITTKI